MKHVFQKELSTQAILCVKVFLIGGIEMIKSPINTSNRQAMENAFNTYE